MIEHMDGAEVKRAAKGMAKIKLESAFLESWRRLFPGLPMPKTQHRFDSRRRWRFDFAWVEYRLGVEIDGGSFSGGRHNRGLDQAKDYEKRNAAVLDGWRVLNFNTAQMRDPDHCAELTAMVLTNAKEREAS